MDKNLKRNSGITLITLVVTIVVLLILASVGTYAGIEAIQNSKYTKFTTELKIMQTYVNSWYEELKPTDVSVSGYDNDFSENIRRKFEAFEVNATKASLDSEAKDTLDAISDTDYSDYYVLDSNVKNALNIEGVDQDVLVNVKKRKVVSKYGFTNTSGETIYVLDEDNDAYNVSYSNANISQSPILNTVQTEQLNSSSWKITATSVTYRGYTSFKSLQYQKTGNSTQQETPKNYCVVNETGEYTIRVVDTAGNVSNDQTITIY